jgi:hypothetical protein
MSYESLRALSQLACSVVSRLAVLASRIGRTSAAKWQASTKNDRKKSTACRCGSDCGRSNSQLTAFLFKFHCFSQEEPNISVQHYQASFSFSVTSFSWALAIDASDRALAFMSAGTFSPSWSVSNKTSQRVKRSHHLFHTFGVTEAPSNTVIGRLTAVSIWQHGC